MKHTTTMLGVLTVLLSAATVRAAAPDAKEFALPDAIEMVKIPAAPSTSRALPDPDERALHPFFS